MTGHEYEHVAARYLQRHGYYGVEVTKGSGDFGVDVIARRGLAKYAVQCKYYNHPVGLGAVQEVTAGMAYYGCDAAMVITNSTFTAAARELATHNGVKLIERVNGLGFGIPPKWILIAAALYIFFAVAPMTVLLYDMLRENHSLKNIVNAIGGFAVITVPFWIAPMLRLLLRQMTLCIGLIAEKIKNRKTRNRRSTATPERTAQPELRSASVIDLDYVISRIDSTEGLGDIDHGAYYADLAKKAVVACAGQNHVSASLIQRRCGLTFGVAMRVKDFLEREELIRAKDGSDYAFEWTEKARGVRS